MPLQEACGISAVYLKKGTYDSVVPFLYSLSIAQVNRGDLSTGISRFNENNPYQILNVYKDVGTPDVVFGKLNTLQYKETINKLGQGSIGLGHVRYATSSLHENIQYLAQPYLRSHHRKFKEFTFCFNGNLFNLDYLKENIKSKNNLNIRSSSDTEIIQLHISEYLNKFTDIPENENYVEMFSYLSTVFEGSYNICFLDANGTLILIRDPLGFKPLSYAENEHLFAAASESSALRHIGLDDIQTLLPGHILIKRNQSQNYNIYSYENKPTRRCSFEYIYFMKAGSSFDNISVQKVREKMGYELAKQETIEFNENVCIAPVPKTSISMRTGYVNGLLERNLKFNVVDLLIQENYGRTFIDDSSGDRLARVRDKFDITPGSLEGKDLVLIDDSIVRGNTSKSLIKYIRKYSGVNRIHFRVGSPPIKYPCFYGINMSTCSELIAHTLTIENIREELEVDSLIYLTEAQLISAIGTEELCMACFNKDYPTPGVLKFSESF